MSLSLLKLQIGPVQEFIAQARSTRDLWSGSYLLSWLMGKASAKLLCYPETTLIFPAEAGQPLISFHKTGKWDGDQKSLLTPNLPNILVARLPRARADEIANAVEQSIKGEWEAIYKSAWRARHELGIEEDQEFRFESQATRLLSIAWQVTPETGNHADDYLRNGWQLDAVRQTRNFLAWGTGAYCRGLEKDSLTGKEEAVAGGKDCAALVKERFKHLFKHDDYLGAITLIKRVWHLTYLADLYLADLKKLKTSSREFPIPSTRGIAMRKPDSDGDLDNVDALPGEKYFAVLALDGDQIGKWIAGEFTDLTEAHHRSFSSCLATFALQKAHTTVEQHTGRLIYAGGDDVLALLPADSALACAQALRQVFRAATESIKGKDKSKDNVEVSPECSVGIAIAHFKSPLQDVIREAQLAEKRAKSPPEKGGLGRAAVAVTLLKRSGEIIQWGCQWDKHGLILYDEIARAMDEMALSGRFPHRVCELLEPYRTSKTGLSKLADVAEFNAAEIIQLEFRHAALRQGSKEVAQQLEKPLENYLGHLSGTEEQLASVIGLCQTVAFAQRNKDPNPAIPPKGEP